MKERVIKKRGGFSLIDTVELWTYRELFFFLALRNVLIRYKQALIGVSWAVIRPLLIMLVFSFIFGEIAKLPSEGVPYPLLTFVALLPWQFFANSLTEGSNSLIGNVNMISKVYVPRIILPASAILSGIIDFLISFLILLALMLWYKIVPTMSVLWLPFFIFLAIFTSFGASLWFAALNVEYRDVRYIVPFIVQMGLYISPVGFSSSVIPEKWRLIYSLNPMVGVIDGFRWALLGGNVQPYWNGIILSIVVVLILLVSGLYYFRRTERTFADII